MDHQKVTLAVESICEMGCSSVHAIIETLESGKMVTGTENFSQPEIIALTNELKAIMAVYENSSAS